MVFSDAIEFGTQGGDQWCIPWTEDLINSWVVSAYSGPDSEVLVDQADPDDWAILELRTYCMPGFADYPVDPNCTDWDFEVANSSTSLYGMTHVGSESP